MSTSNQPSNTIGTLKAAERLGCTTAWVETLARRGRIAARKESAVWLLCARSVEEYRRRRRRPGRPPKQVA